MFPISIIKVKMIRFHDKKNVCTTFLDTAHLEKAARLARKKY